MKVQRVEEWYLKSYAAFMKALKLKLGENYMLKWRACGATLNLELGREEGWSRNEA